MASGRSSEHLLDRLADQLGTGRAAIVVKAIADSATRPDILDGVLVLLDELTEEAPKAAKGAIDALVDLQGRDLLVDVLPWLDLGVAIAADSGALALRFFKESPLLLGLLELLFSVGRGLGALHSLKGLGLAGVHDASL